MRFRPSGIHPTAARRRRAAVFALALLLGLAGCAGEDAFELGARFWFTEPSSSALLAVDLARDEPCQRQTWLDRPLGPLAIGPDERLFAVDPVARALFELDPVLGLLDPIGEIVGAVRPQALAADELGRLWLLDDSRWLHRLDPVTGRSIARWTLQPPGDYVGLAVAPRVWAMPGEGEIADGDLLVLRSLPATSLIGLLSPDGDVALVRELGGVPPLRALIDSRREGVLYGLSREGGTFYAIDPVSGEADELGQAGCEAFDVVDGARP